MLLIGLLKGASGNGCFFWVETDIRRNDGLPLSGSSVGESIFRRRQDFGLGSISKARARVNECNKPISLESINNKV